MNLKNKIARLVSHAKSPKAMAIYGIVGVVTTAALTAIGTWKAKDIYDKYQESQDYEDSEGKMVTGIKMAACYIPAVASATGSIAAIAKSTKGYDRALKTMTDISKGQVGQIQRLGDLAAGAALKDVYPGFENRPEDLNLEPGEYIFCEEYSGVPRYFKCSMEQMLDAEIMLNRCLNKHECVSLNYFYYAINQPVVPGGYDRGWSREGLYDSDCDTIVIDKILKTDEEGNEYYLINFPYAPHSPYRDEDPDQFSGSNFEDI